MGAYTLVTESQGEGTEPVTTAMGAVVDVTYPTSSDMVRSGCR